MIELPFSKDMPQDYDRSVIQDSLDDLVIRLQNILNDMTSSPLVDHNSLGGLQGGSTTERYHITSAQVSALHAAVTNSITGITLTGQALSLTSGYVIPTTTEQSAWHARSHTLLSTSDHSDVGTYLNQALLTTSSPLFTALTAATIYGSSAAGGDILIRGTSDATPGSITLGHANGDLYIDSATGANSMTGSLAATSFLRGTYLESTIAIGTAPLVITSTTKVSNLNVDAVDGYHLDQAVAIGSSVVFANLYGSSAVGGDLNIESTSNATKGFIYLGASGKGIKIDTVGLSHSIAGSLTMTGTSTLTVPTLAVTGGSTLGTTNQDLTIIRGNLTLTDSASTAYCLAFGDNSQAMYKDGAFAIRTNATLQSDLGFIVINGSYKTTITTGATANWTLTLPTTAGTDGYVLKTNGSGVTSWVTQSLPALAIGKMWVGNISDEATAVTLSGDVTVSATGTTAIGNDKVTYAKMQNVSDTSKVLGRISAGAGDVEELTAANLKTMCGYYTSGDNASFGTLTATQLTVNDAGADLDTRIEGDTDANLVFVDASTDRVGIGTNAPGTKVDINGVVSIRAASALRMYDSSNTVYSSLVMYKANGTTLPLDILYDNYAFGAVAGRFPVIYPATDGTTAIQIKKADAATVVATFDTTNSIFSAANIQPTTAYKAVDGTVGLAGTKVYYVSDSSGGTVNRKLTFKDGLLVSET